MKKHSRNEDLASELENLGKTTMSRRVFLGRAGKTLALGILSHFVMLGNLNANESSPSHDERDSEAATPSSEDRNNCSLVTSFVCHEHDYTCNETQTHSCSAKFSCGTGFTCIPTNANSCTSSMNNCVPVFSFSIEF